MPHRPASPSVWRGRRTAPDEAGAPSPRVRLARLALDVALGLPDVLGAEAGPHGLRVTGDRSTGVLRGVSVTAEGDGRYAVDLRLVARMVPLVPLAEEIQRRVRLRAGREGLDAELGAVNVEFGRLVTSEEVVAEAARAAEAAAAAAAAPGATEEPPPGGVEIPSPARAAAPPSGDPEPSATGAAPPPSDLEPPPTGLAPPPSDLEPPPTGLAPPPSDLEPPPAGLAPPPSDLEPPPTGLAPPPTDPALPPVVPPAPDPVVQPEPQPAPPPDRGGGP